MMKKGMKRVQAVLLLTACGFLGAALLPRQAEATAAACASIGCRIAGTEICGEVVINGQVLQCHERVRPDCI